MVSCYLVSPDAGKFAYLIQATVQGQPVYTLELDSFIVNADGKWNLLKQSPIYTIDHVNGEFKWLLTEPMLDSSSGSSI